MGLFSADSLASIYNKVKNCKKNGLVLELNKYVSAI